MRGGRPSLRGHDTDVAAASHCKIRGYKPGLDCDLGRLALLKFSQKAGGIAMVQLAILADQWFYAEYGAGFEKSFRDLRTDHIAVELAFMSYLAYKEHESEDPLKYLEGKERFLINHLLT